MVTRIGHHIGLKHSPVRKTLASMALLFSVSGMVEVHHAFAQQERIEQRVLQTDDDWQIAISFFGPLAADKDPTAKETPAVILLHGDKENRLAWNTFAKHLQAEGYAVVSVDLRKHGESTNVARIAGDSPAGGKNTEGTNLHADDYQAMVNSDMEAVKRFVYEQNQAKRLNMNKIAIIAAESSAAVAIHFAVNDWNKEPYDDAPSDDAKTPRGQDVRALVLLSPQQKVKGLPLGEALSAVREPDWNIAILTLYGKLNRSDARDATAIYRRIAGNSKLNEDRIFVKGYNVNLRGIHLLGKKEVDAEAAIDTFLHDKLKDLRRSEWRNRQSRLTAK
jgi:alpha-beta hydrolase superfamily lysophospholipase